MELEYPRFYYETIASTGIDPVICGSFGEGLPGTMVGEQPVQLAAKALAKASEGSARVPRKRAPKKAAPKAK